MVSKFQEFLQHKETERPPHFTIDGQFGCQHCHEVVSEADLYPSEKMLVWQCPDGHVSYVEDFGL